MRVWLVGLVIGCSSGSAGKATRPETSDGFPICSGQTVDAAANDKTSRRGAMPLQLAPSFLDRMAACPRSAAEPPAELAVATAGTVSEKGDCEWPSGVVCHFHLGAEFVELGSRRPKAGELHCIFPTSDPKSPHVFGTHFTCKEDTAVTPGHDIHPGKACGAGLLGQLSATMARCNARCCDDGTLTTPAADRKTQGKLDVRPDFRICTETAELDCSQIATLTGHPANAPVFGPPIDDGM